MRWKVVTLLLALAVALPTDSRAQENVDLALALLVDVSGSVNTTEFNLQRTGYVRAFQSAAVQTAIQSGVLGQIAVSFIYWSGATQQNVAVDWTIVSDAASASALATTINNTTRPFSGTTGVGAALQFGADYFSQLGAFGIGNAARWVIDLSGDGTSNSGVAAATGRDYAAAAGVDVINALAIQSASLVPYFENNVIHGADAFVNFAATFDDFAVAVEDKMVREITDPTVVPEPISMLLLGTGLAGVGAVARRRKTLLERADTT